MRRATFLIIALLGGCGDGDELSSQRGTDSSPSSTPQPVAPASPGAPPAGTTPAPASPSGAGDIVARPPATTPCALDAVIRDFRAAHPDFEDIVNPGVITGLMEPMLGPDRKPRMRPQAAMRASIHAFDDWYNDRPGTNLPHALALTLEETSDGVYVFDSDAFFPLDGMGFDERIRGHNFHFTTEVHTTFRYRGGERFTFAGDDDVWVYINGRLAIDLGGVRLRETATVDLDARASELGITPGHQYTMDIFHAERHTTESNFRIETTIDCFTTVI